MKRLPALLSLLAAVSVVGCRHSAPSASDTAWQSLFNGIDLTGWERTDFAGGSEPEVRDGQIVVPMSAMLGGVHWTNAATLPTTNYELELEAMKIDGNDFFCGLTFPVGTTHCSLIVGGWGGGVVGLSSIDGQDASANETTRDMYLERNRWFPVRLRVTPERITAWIEDKVVADVSIGDRKIHLRAGDIELSKPLGLSSFQTTAGFRNIRLRRLP